MTDTKAMGPDLAGPGAAPAAPAVPAVPAARRPPRAAVAVAALAIAAAAWWWFGRGAVPAGAGAGVLKVSGTIEGQDVAISAELPGRIQAIHVSQGESVRAGQLLVELDATLLQEQLRQAEAGAAAARARALQAETALKLLQGQVDTQARQADAALQLARENLAAAERARDQVEALYRQGAISLRDRDNGLISYRAALGAMQNAEFAVQAAETARLQIPLKQQELASAQAQARQAEAAADALRQQIARAALRSPVDGVVALRHLEPGEMAGAGAAILTVRRTGDLWLWVYVPETRIGRVRLGDQATVTVDSLPGRAFAAEVAEIASKAEFTPRNVQTPEERAQTVFRVKLRLREGEGELKPGMPADAVFRP